VTLCIAAECDCAGSPAIGMCADWRAQTGSTGGPLIGTEDAYKIRDLGCMSVMISGRPSDAQQLIAACKDAVNRFGENASNADSDLVIARLQKDLRHAAGKRKQEIIEDFVLQNVGIPYGDFRQIRTEHWNEAYAHVWDLVRRLDLGADLIFCGFCGDIPVIIRLDRFGNAPWEDRYTVAGEGADIARAMLCLQPWGGYFSGDPLDLNPAVPLDHCIYRLFEAKTAAHLAHPSSVGRETAFEVIVFGKGTHSVSFEITDEARHIFDNKHTVPNLESLWYDPVPGKGGIRARKRRIEARNPFDLLTKRSR
jgi:hypothetical protein